ncbi:metal-dependent hydrolase [Halovenus sp. WSH3]|uniref:Metal-dependent hydrolase n=1 Tax=Halovenus carboxidivorans TaxID=2692199 RepID=A0A6B0T3F7_9EURY|nr:metal-dependent hydrolase [Halovenus carboxidivorans]MXR52808.1 metal-dependent hydrolase [Halovenus carboxidivorans]
MWPIGHASVAYLLYTFSTRSRFDEPPRHAPTLVLGVAALLPDLIDKPLAWQLGVLPGGRTLGHSLLVLGPLSLAGYAVADRIDARESGVAFALGLISHALLDVVPVFWEPTTPWEGLFWPLLASGPGPDEATPTVLGLLQNSLTAPYFYVEFLLLAAALYVWRVDGYPGLRPFAGRLTPA